MSLINLNNAFLSFGDEPILDSVNFSLEKNERVCLVGRNGAGKSSLLKVLSNDLIIDEGTLSFQQNCIIERLDQNLPENQQISIFDFITQNLNEEINLLNEFEQITAKLKDNSNESLLKKLTELQENLDRKNSWQWKNRVLSTLKLFDLQENELLSNLSGGWLKKAILARALVKNPDVLLLDEPTNHLDIPSINWLEKFLLEFKGSLVFISHDRTFIENLATRIIDLDRGNLMSFNTNYQNYLVQKEEQLKIEEQQNALFDKKLSQEEIWIRQGVKARRTRNEGRIRELKELRKQFAERRNQIGQSKLNIDESIRSGKIIFNLDNISFSYGNKKIINDFSLTVQRGDRIALIGKNGSGKSTLIKLMLQEISPNSGKIHIGTKLDLAYFDQYRETLDLEKTVLDNVNDGKQEITINGHSRHVLSYLQDFLFTPKRAMTPVKALSGGERNRLLFAKLFRKPTNLLILDEPTNDLDIETLELLEEKLSDYTGTILLVSHDRTFINNIVSACLVFGENGKIDYFLGNYDDAIRHSNLFLEKEKTAEKTDNLNKKINQKEEKTNKKLSYNEQRELNALPNKIAEIEKIIEKLEEKIADPNFFTKPHEETNEILSNLSAKNNELEILFLRWEELENQ